MKNRLSNKQLTTNWRDFLHGIPDTSVRSGIVIPSSDRRGSCCLLYGATIKPVYGTCV